jgi:diguanylate cyclase (GGDEF)-like protein
MAAVSVRLYVVGQVILLTAAALPVRASGFFNLVAGTIGLATYVVAVAVRRPRPASGWWLLAAGAVMEFLAAIGYTVAYGFHSDAQISAVLPVAVAAAAPVATAAGLARLGRLARHGGPADLLDSVMIALAAFLLLWALVIDPALDLNRGSSLAAIVFPLGELLVLAAAVKLMFGDGHRDPVLRLVLLAMLALLGSGLAVLVPALGTGFLQNSQLAGVLWAGYATLLGAAGIHPSLERPRERRLRGPENLPWLRMIMFVALALIAPAAWLLELYDKDFRLRNDPIERLVPVITASILLLLLVARLGLIARLAQRRAGELSVRSRDLTVALEEQQDLRQQLAHRAMHDPLTGLPNRVVLGERLEWAFSRRVGSQRHALLLFDIDGFKDINDTYGHPVGDELLIEVARRLLAAVPTGATVARVGGDEFAVLVEDIYPGTAHDLGEALLNKLRRSYAVGGRDLYATVSVGLLTTDVVTGTLTPSDALRDADLALFAAKNDGKNRMAVFKPQLRAARLDTSRISAGLRRALVEDEFVLHYQPIVDLETGAIVAVEALVRWQLPDGGLVSPTEFIPIAEDTGLINPIGALVLRRACHETRRWYDRHGVAVSVNVSARQLDDPLFTDTVIAALARSGLPGPALIVEVTESNLVATNHADAVHGRLQRLRDIGVRIAIDDFGTGYSSLSYVSKLPVDLVKIDRSFTQSHGDAAYGGQDWTFTRAVLQLVDSLHLQAIAEGVETEAQAQALRAMRCSMAQGFLFSKPVRPEVIDQALSSGNKALARIRS